jgi:fermentation-respiration switch protein FrsA (DUF1100 family)
MKVRGMLIATVLTLTGLYLVLCLLVYIFQDRLIFLPDRTLAVTPDQQGMKYENVRIPVVSAETIHAWYFPSVIPSDTAVTVLICHGNAGNISHRLGTARLFLDLGCNVLLFDYRGYGLSDGQASEANAYADARASWDWLVGEKKARPGEIVIFGRSLGGAVAVELAGRVKCRGLILESTFTSVADMAGRLYPLLPVRFLVRTRFDSASRIGSLTCPILMAHSPTDEVVPYELGRKLFEAAGSRARFFDLEGGHNELKSLNNELYRKALRDFILAGPKDSTI